MSAAKANHQPYVGRGDKVAEPIRPELHQGPVPPHLLPGGGRSAGGPGSSAAPAPRSGVGPAEARPIRASEPPPVALPPAEDDPGVRVYTSHSDAGEIVLQAPERLTAEEVADLEAWFSLIVRAYRRALRTPEADELASAEAGAGGEVRTERVTLLLGPAEKRRFEAEAEAAGTSLGSWLRRGAYDRLAKKGGA